MVATISTTVVNKSVWNNYILIPKNNNYNKKNKTNKKKNSQETKTELASRPLLNLALIFTPFIN